MTYPTNQQPIQQDPMIQPQHPPMHQPVQQPHMPKPAGSYNRSVISQKTQQLFILIYTAMAVILSARFIFSLLGLTLTAPFVNFVYQLSQPFIGPFANMFGVTIQAGHSRIEFETLVALVVYALIFFGVAKLIGIIFD